MSLVGAKGVDIGDHNGSVDFNCLIKAGVKFVMLKVGIGSDIKEQDDTRFEENVRKAEIAGIPWGAWLYSYALNKEQALSEVEHMKRLLKGKRPTMPIAIDMEDADGYKRRNNAWNYSTVNMICKTFVDGIRAAGFYPMIYTGYYEIRDYISREVVNSCDIWLAEWSRYPDYNASNLGMWQYGGETNLIESNSISGVGVIDKDKCYKDYPTIIKNGGYNGWAKGSGGSSGEEGQKIYIEISMPYLARSGYINTGEEVKTVQLLLNAMNYGILTVDGIFGEATEQAVKKFQKSRGLDQDGIVGQDTWRYLLK